MAALTLTSIADADDSAKKKKAVDPILKKYDADGDGRLSMDERRAWFKDRRAAALKKYDKNKDGKLDDAERKALAKDRASAIMTALDKNKDGKLSRLEVGKARGIRFRRLRRAFDRIDFDSDGNLTVAELETVLGKRRRRPGKRRMRKGGKAI